jgi:two-component sensor histidine kinase/HAMP domain-containing protein
MTIRKQLLTSILLAGVPLLCLGTYSIIHHYKSQKRLILEKEMETAQTMASLLEIGVRHLVQHHRMVGRFIAQNPHRTREALAWVRQSSPLVVRSGYLRPDGRFAILDPPLSGPGTVNVFDRSYFQALLQGKEWILSDLLISRARGDLIVGLALPVWNQKRVLVGVLTSGIRPEGFTSLLRFRAEEGTYFGIVDGSGRLISSNLSQDLTWEQRDWSREPGVQQALAGVPTTVDRFVHPLERTPLMGAWVPVPALGWAVGVMDEIDQIMQPVQMAGLIQLGSLGSMVLLFLVLALGVAGRLSRPIMGLAETARKLGQGDLAQRAEVKGGDEVTVLAGAFNRMAEDIASSQAVLRRQAEELKRKASELQILYELSRQLDSTLPLEKLLEVALVKVRELVGADLALISVFDETTERLVFRSYPEVPQGHLQAMLRVQAERWASGEEARGEEPLLVDRVSQRHGLSSLAAALCAVASLIDVPLRVKGKTIGTITLTSSLDGRFTERDIPFLSAVASAVAVSIGNARLHAAAVRRGEELAALLRATQTVMAGLDLQVILQRIVDEASRIAGTPHVRAFLVDRDAQFLRAGAATGTSMPTGLQVPMDTSFSGTAATTRRPLFVPDTRNDPRKILTPRDRGFDFVTYLGLPIKVRGEVVGVLAFYTEAPRIYTQDDLAYLASFADQAAIAIENARLYSQTKEDADAKALLVRELDHRVRNNLATIVGLLSMELGRKGDWTTEEALQACIDRVQSLATIHDLLGHDEFKEPDLKQLVEAVATAAVKGFSSEENVEIAVSAPPLRLPPKSLSALALATNELITNALKHAFRSRDTGRIEVQVEVQGKEIRLEVRDNGVGTPVVGEEGLHKGVGLDIVTSLVRTDLRGEFQLRNERGTVATIRFPKPQPAEV